MKYHKCYEDWINFLSNKFPEIPRVEIVIRSIDILTSLIENNNSACVGELCYELNLSENRIRVRIRELELEGIVTSKKEKKTNTSYKKKYYSCNIEEDMLKEIRRCMYCNVCGEKVGRLGGILHTNRSLHETKIFCSKECRDRWCFDVARN